MIESYEHDQALLNYGGYCVACVDGEKPGLRDALQGRPERMNDVSEQEELLREVSMSGGHTILYHGHVPTGTTLTMIGNGSPELVTVPPGAPVVPREPMKFVMLSGASAREYIREEVHKALYPEVDGIVSAHEHRRVELHEENGDVWRGVLYKVNKED